MFFFVCFFSSSLISEQDGQTVDCVVYHNWNLEQEDLKNFGHKFGIFTFGIHPLLSMRLSARFEEDITFQ